MQSSHFVSRLSRAALVAAMAAGLPLAAKAAPTGLDGVIGSEWAGVTATHVLFDSTAPVSNFGAPSNKNHNVGYDVYVRTDAQYFYAGLKTTGPAVNSLVFANLYLALVYGGGSGYSLIGFETTNDKAFDLSASPTPKDDTAANLIQTAVFTGTDSEPDVIEVAIELSALLSNPLGVVGYDGLPTGQTADGVALLMSQSFGYSVAGGTAAYGPNYLGFAAIQAVPEPASIGLAGLALAALGFTTRGRKQKSA